MNGRYCRRSGILATPGGVLTPPCCIPSVSVGVSKLPWRGRATTFLISYSCLGIPLAAGGQVIPPSPDFQVFRQVILSFEHSCNARCVVTVRYTYCFPGIRKVPDGLVTPRYSYIARWGSEASLKLSSGIPTCIPVSGQVFLQRQVWVVTPRFRAFL